MTPIYPYVGSPVSVGQARAFVIEPNGRPKARTVSLTKASPSRGGDRGGVGVRWGGGGELEQLKWGDDECERGASHLPVQ